MPPRPRLAIERGVGTPIFDELFERLAAGEFAPPVAAPSPLAMPLHSARRVSAREALVFPLPVGPDGRLPRSAFVFVRLWGFRRRGRELTVFVSAVISTGPVVRSWVSSRTVAVESVPFSGLRYQSTEHGVLVSAPGVDEVRACPVGWEAFERLRADVLGDVARMVLSLRLLGFVPSVRVAGGGFDGRGGGAPWPLGAAQALEREAAGLFGALQKEQQVVLPFGPRVAYVDPVDYPPRPDEVVIATDGSWRIATHHGGVAWVSSEGGSWFSTGKFATIRDAERAAVNNAIAYACSKFPDRDVVVLTDNRSVALEKQQVVHTHAGLRVEWVRGHDGHPLNEGAHRLAMAARRCREFGTPDAVFAVQRQRIVDDSVAGWRVFRGASRGVG
ncbi:hypothetical protein CAQU_09700 [Corynebacterium aquilae DSM 44791]|uniref:Uncharacterized protein n=2 Tax=Corynebacterium aquilae TaxID=203263 RepID=A0A1L7CHG7_9CORY|nr:hypothetical protein CAQU_09700 [Corynebacterium aquilae DSM 44791]